MPQSAHLGFSTCQTTGRTARADLSRTDGARIERPCRSPGGGPAVLSGCADELKGAHVAGVVGGFIRIEDNVFAAGPVEFLEILDGKVEICWQPRERTLSETLPVFRSKAKVKG